MSFKGKNLKFQHVKVVYRNEYLNFVTFRCENNEEFILDLDTNTLKFRGYNQVSVAAMAEVLAWLNEFKVVTSR